VLPKRWIVEQTFSWLTRAVSCYASFTPSIKFITEFYLALNKELRITPRAQSTEVCQTTRTAREEVTANHRKDWQGGSYCPRFLFVSDFSRRNV
jgi:hypothetical protein